jgi:hypothetical protein
MSGLRGDTFFAVIIKRKKCRYLRSGCHVLPTSTINLTTSSSIDNEADVKYAFIVAKYKLAYAIVLVWFFSSSK